MPVDPTAPIVPPVRRPGRRRLAAAAAAGSLALVGVAGVVVGASDTTGPSGLRTAEVDHQEVVETLDLTGTVAPVAQGAVAFPTAGTVASVDVAVGDRVAVGQLLATLATTDLDAAVVAAQEALAVAQLSLEQALAGETVTDPPVDGTTSGSPTGRQPTAAGVPILTAEVLPIAAPGGVTDEEVAAAQQAVLDAATAATDALAAADASLALATDVCAALGTPDAGPTVAEDCRAALEQVVADQQAAAAALAARGQAADALDALLAERAAEEPEAPPTTTPPTTTPSPSPPSTAPRGSDPAAGGDTEAPSGGSPSGADADPDAGSSPSAEELIAYQSAVDAAAAQLLVAQQALDQATIVSPLAGTVVSIGVAVGDEVTAGSSTATVVVVGDGGYEVTTTVPVDELAELEVGQPVTVAVDGAAAPLTGEVVAVGLSSTEGESGRTYPVTIGLTSSADLRNGTLADLSIALATSTDAVAVPTSAVDLSGAQATVTVLDEDGGTSEVPVVLGAVGGAYVEVSGVEVGAVVVLADLSEPLPESDTGSGSPGAGEVRGPMGGTGPVMTFGPPG